MANQTSSNNNPIGLPWCLRAILSLYGLHHSDPTIRSLSASIALWWSRLATVCMVIYNGLLVFLACFRLSMDESHFWSDRVLSVLLSCTCLYTFVRLRITFSRLITLICDSNSGVSLNHSSDRHRRLWHLIPLILIIIILIDFSIRAIRVQLIDDRLNPNMLSDPTCTFACVIRKNTINETQQVYSHSASCDHFTFASSFRLQSRWMLVADQAMYSLLSIGWSHLCIHYLMHSLHVLSSVHLHLLQKHIFTLQQKPITMKTLLNLQQQFLCLDNQRALFERLLHSCPLLWLVQLFVDYAAELSRLRNRLHILPICVFEHWFRLIALSIHFLTFLISSDRVNLKCRLVRRQLCNTLFQSRFHQQSQTSTLLEIRRACLLLILRQNRSGSCDMMHLDRRLLLRFMENVLSFAIMLNALVYDPTAKPHMASKTITNH